jgi:hypothetical protein
MTVGTGHPQPLGQGFSRRGLLKGGVVAGLGAFGLTVASSALAPGIARAGIIGVLAETDAIVVTDQFNAQDGWRYCIQCRNLYYAPENGPCVIANDHTTTSTTNYAVPNGNGFPHGNVHGAGDSGGNSLVQSPWRWCSECSLLFYGPDVASSWCWATRGQHFDDTNGVYNMLNGTWFKSTPLQEGWRYCYNCKVLYWGGAYTASACVYQFLIDKGGNVNNGNNGFGQAPGDTVYYVFIPVF